VPLAAGLVASGYTEDEQAGTLLWVPELIAGPLMLFGVPGALIYSYKNWRCPACNKYLGSSLFRKTCPACGIEVR
jgi:hypothetical protein